MNKIGTSFGADFELTTTLQELDIFGTGGENTVCNYSFGLKFMNRTGSAVTVTMHLCGTDADGVPEAPSTANRILNAFSVSANTTSPVDVADTLPFASEGGKKLYAVASANTAISLRVTGNVY